MAGRPSVRRPSRATSSPIPDSASGAGANVTVPRLNTDPVFSLGLWPIEVSIGTKVIEVPAMPAVDWLAYLLQATPDLDGLLSNLLPEIEDALYDDLMPEQDLYLLVLDIISTVSAHPWWVTLRLVNVAHQNWDSIGPELMFNGVDPTVISLAAWVDATLLIMLRSMDPKKITMFVMQLEIPPKDLQLTEDSSELPQFETNRNVFLSMAD